MTRAALDALYAAHLDAQPVCPTDGVRWPVEHTDACDCARCDDYRADMRAWEAREVELAEACAAGESAEAQRERAA